MNDWVNCNRRCDNKSKPVLVSFVNGIYKLTSWARCSYSKAAGVNVNIEYIQFEWLIVEAHHIDLLVWPNKVIFANPSKITCVADLNKVHAALIEGICHWPVHLSAEEVEACQTENFRQLNAGKDPYALGGGETVRTASRKWNQGKENETTEKHRKGKRSKNIITDDQEQVAEVSLSNNVANCMQSS